MLKLLLLTLSFLSLAAQTASAQLVFKTTNWEARSSQLVVVIHGCLQSAESMAMGTGINNLLGETSSLVFYPKVPSKSNDLDCWSWFNPDNQSYDKGQLHDLIKQIHQIRIDYKIKNKKFHVLGISSGAITAAGLAACFPEQILSVGLHSGTAYGLAQNEDEASKVLKNGPPKDLPVNRKCDPKKYEGPLTIIQGTTDVIVNAKHADFIVQDFKGNGLPEKRIEREAEGMTYTESQFFKNEQLTAKVFMIRQLPHAWVGAHNNITHPKLIGPGTINPQQIPFFYNKGPNASRIFLQEAGLISPSQSSDL